MTYDREKSMRLAIALGLVCALAWGGVRSDEPVVYTLHIESQPLDGALQVFARQTGMQILFFSDVTEGLRSGALDGKYTMEAAMSALLSGSKLTYRLINAKTIQISANPRTDRSHPQVTRRKDSRAAQLMHRAAGAGEATGGSGRCL